MPQAHLTKRALDAAVPRPERYDIYDERLPGFGLRVSPNGEKTWFIMYRAGDGGRGAAKRRLTLGKACHLTPEEARERAKTLLAAIRLGDDPAAAKVQRRAAATVADLAACFVSEHLEAKRKPRTTAHYRDIIDRLILPTLGPSKAEAVTRGQVAALHLAHRATPYQANRMLAVLGSMYGFGARRGLVPEGLNPAAKVERYRESRRERFLSADELKRLGAAIREAETVGIPWRVDEDAPGAKHLPNPGKRFTRLSPGAAAALRLLVYTGMRVGEVLALRWDEVDLERGLLLLADSKTGRKTIVLNAPAMDILRSIPRTGPFVVAGDDPEGSRADLKRPWAVVARHAGLEGVRLHDLRHTFASIGAGGGLGLPIIGALLGHADVATTQRYAHLAADPLRRATDAVGKALADAMDGT